MRKMTVKAKKTRELLLRTAINLFAEKGYAETSIRDIGIRADISTSIMYHYFKGKEDILFEVITTSSHELTKMLEEIRERIQDPVECLIEMLMTHIVRFSLKRREETQVLAANNHLLTGENRIICRKIQREIYDIYSAQLKVIAEHNLMKNLDPTVVVFSIFGMINSFYAWYDEKGRLSKEEVAQNILGLILRGIIKE
jgi:AcrR family transcriptional regulator